MICRRCGNRVPEYLTTREYFQCPSCGRSFGTPPEEPRRAYEPRAERENSRAYRGERPAARPRFEEPVRRERGEATYNNRRAQSRFADDDYYENRRADYDPYREKIEPEEEFYDEPAYSGDDLNERNALPATMKLTTLIGFEALALIALAVVWLVSLGL